MDMRNKAYRRRIKELKKKRLMQIINTGGYNPARGYVDWGLVNGQWRPVGKYIKYPKNSNAERYWKRHSNRIVRKKNEIYRGNQYRKCFDYWWTLY